MTEEQNFVRFRVDIEFKRIQTFLFLVPKLRTMLGANALLGEVIRIRLPRLAASSPSAGLAVPTTLGAAAAPQVLDADPLSRKGLGPANWLPDDPEFAYRNGVLSRDGGHFKALFSQLDHAHAFVTNARALMEAALPGLSFDLAVLKWSGSEGSGQWEFIPPDSQPAAAGDEHFFEWPDQERCAVTGTAAATHTIHEGKAAKRVSRPVALQWLMGKRFAKGKARDVVSLLQQARAMDDQDAAFKSLPCFDPKDWRQADDLHQLAGGHGRYLALIYLDGNDVGGGIPKWRGSTTCSFQEWLEHEAGVEAYFHSMRSMVRAALCGALHDTFERAKPEETDHRRPYQLMMVGGDDVLVAMAAAYALPFVVALERRVQQLQKPQAESKEVHRPFTFGAGVAIAKASYPFHRLHELAEELAGSAKRLSRGAAKGHSVVDWAVLSQASMQQLAEHRCLHDQVVHKGPDSAPNERLVFSLKPYAVSRDLGVPALESLLNAANALNADLGAARSQRKLLQTLIRQGRLTGTYAFEDWFGSLPRDTAGRIRESFVSSFAGSMPAPWIRLSEEGDSASVDATPWLDLVEVAEIERLGRRRRRPAKAPRSQEDRP